MGPKELTPEEITHTLFAGAIPANLGQHAKHFAHCAKTITTDLHDWFNENASPDLPYESEEEIELCLQSWCVGFIEGFFCHEALWFKSNEEVAAELLMPMMVLSGLFEDEDFSKIRKNDKIMAQLETIMPEQLTDIFLYYHAR